MLSHQVFAGYFISQKTKKVWDLSRKFKSSVLDLIDRIGSLGTTLRMDYLERRKLKIFNLLVFFQLLTIAILPAESIFKNTLLPVLSIEMLIPAFINSIVLWLNYYQKYDAARIFYFIVSPIVTGLIYVGGIDLGAELNFVLYGILAVFFITNIGEMIFSIALSMITYFMLSFLLVNYQLQLQTVSFPLYLLNQALTLVFIFYGLYLIKTENTSYQRRLLIKGRMLHNKNQEILRQRKEISYKAELLEKQTVELKEINAIKDKLFSIIAHDMKTPLYALKNLFQQIQQNNMNGRDIKNLMPEIVKDLNFTTELMDNLLLWTRSQMESTKIKPGLLELSQLMENVLQLLRLPAKAKRIYVENEVTNEIYALGDRDMVHLVLRNLISNAIKFTPSDGRITIGANVLPSTIEVFIKDTGQGMTKAVLQKILRNEFYTTKGTSNEAGTGLGLMLCKEFVTRNGGEIKIDSQPGTGSIFSFTLPKAI